MRATFRYTHLIVAVLLGAYIYSPTLNASAVYQALMQFGVFPVIALSGVAMWQQARLKKWFRHA